MDEEKDLTQAESEEQAGTTADPGSAPDEGEAQPEGEKPEVEPDDDAEPFDGVPEKIQQKINRRIAKLTARRREAEERALEARVRLEAAEAKAAELEKGSQNFEAASKVGLHPDYVTPAEAKLLEQEQYWRDVRRFCQRYPDGYEGTGTGDPSYSAAQIRERFMEADDRLMELLPEAGRVRAQRRKEMDEDLKRGRELRLRKSAPPAGLKKEQATPPRLGGDGSGRTQRPPVSAERRSAPPEFGAKKLMEEGVTPDSLQDAYERIA